MALFCSHCGKELANNEVKICPECGEKVPFNFSLISKDILTETKKIDFEKLRLFLNNLCEKTSIKSAWITYFVAWVLFLFVSNGFLEFLTGIAIGFVCFVAIRKMEKYGFNWWSFLLNISVATLIIIMACALFVSPYEGNINFLLNFSTFFPQTH